MNEAGRGASQRSSWAWGVRCALLAWLLAGCALPPAAPPPSPTPPPGLFVDAAQTLGPISPYVYGSNYGPWLFIPLQMRSAAVEARLTFLRFPGGNWGDLNDLDEWQIDQYIALCRELGAEPSISVRLRGGSPEQAADLVRLVNVTKGYGVRYWAIGNEPNLYPDGYEVATYNQEWRAWAEAMRAVDPEIQLIGPDTSQFVAQPDNPGHQAANDWLASFLEANGDMVDIVAVHRYPFPTSRSGPPPTVAELRDNSREWDAIIPALRTLVKDKTGRDLPLAVTEVNSSWASNSGGEATMDSHYNAIWWADVLGRLIAQDVQIVAQFAVIGEYGLMDKYEVYPIYYVYRMYQHFGTERLRAASDDPTVSLYAARRADGALTLLLVNLASEPVSKPLTMAGFAPAGPAETWLFDATHPAEPVAPTPLGSGANVTLPAESVTLLILPAP